MVRNLPAMQESWVQSLGWEDTLEESMATHSSIFAWRIPTDRGAWQTTGSYRLWGHAGLDTTEQLSIAQISVYVCSMDIYMFMFPHYVERVKKQNKS